MAEQDLSKMKELETDSEDSNIENEMESCSGSMESSSSSDSEELTYPQLLPFPFRKASNKTIIKIPRKSGPGNHPRLVVIRKQKQDAQNMESEKKSSYVALRAFSSFRANEDDDEDSKKQDKAKTNDKQLHLDEEIGEKVKDQQEADENKGEGENAETKMLDQAS